MGALMRLAMFSGTVIHLGVQVYPKLTIPEQVADVLQKHDVCAGCQTGFIESDLCQFRFDGHAIRTFTGDLSMPL